MSPGSVGNGAASGPPFSGTKWRVPSPPPSVPRGTTRSLSPNWVAPITPAAPTSAAIPSPIRAIGTARRGGSGTSRSRSANISSTASGSAGAAGASSTGASATGAGSASSSGSRSGGGGTGASGGGGGSTSGSSSGIGTAARRERLPPAANSSPTVLAAWLQVSGSSSALSTAPRSSPRCRSISSAKCSIARARRFATSDGEHS